MTALKLCLTLCLSTLPATVALAAAPKDHAPDAGAPAVTSETAAAPGSGAAVVDDDLPDLPETHSARLVLAADTHTLNAQPARASRLSFAAAHENGVSPLASLPLAGTARHLGAEHFNTADGSMLAPFAICYRMSDRSSIEVIPGDPAPVKLPVVSVANNTGVTVGLVVRMKK